MSFFLIASLGLSTEHTYIELFKHGPIYELQNASNTRISNASNIFMHLFFFPSSFSWWEIN